MLKIIHHWWLPVISAVVWWGMLIALLTCWAAQGHPVYSWIHNRDKDILYISDISATNLQPIFIACSAVQGLAFALGLASERLLRHNGRLLPNSRRREKRSSYLAIAFAVIGQFGILFVSIFNTRYFNGAHSSMLVVFIVFVGLSSLSSIYEYFYLDKNYPDYRALSISVRYKVVWFIIELIVALAFAFSKIKHVNLSAVFEWLVSFIYPFYSLCIAYDLWPARNRAKGFHLNSQYPDPYGQTEAQNPAVKEEQHNSVTSGE